MYVCLCLCVLESVRACRKVNGMIERAARQAVPAPELLKSHRMKLNDEAPARRQNAKWLPGVSV